MNNIIDIDVIIDEEYIDPKVTIETNAKNTYVESIVDAIENVAENEYPILTGYVDNNAHFILQRDIIRANIENRKVILETEEGTYNVRKSLVALENILNPTRFVKISQSEIINIYKVERFEFDIAGTICVVFLNGEKTWVSRRRVNNLKDIIKNNH
ncbi:MAG: LytTR family transcriptional regulator DNA-binding domain-containing protein [Lachnospiraceae bacterium]|nr:LytTR family transcriptional regulator DNA-binding domain-containing protein [Lachnospiraceae bacterium]